MLLYWVNRRVILKDKLMVLPDDTKVYTGHGEGTSIGYERVHNPFIGA